MPSSNPTSRNSGLTPSGGWSQCPASEPARVVTRRTNPISEKRARYAPTRPGSITRALAKPPEYTSQAPRGRLTEPLAKASAKDEEAVDVEAAAATDHDPDRVGRRGREMDRPEDLAVV